MRDHQLDVPPPLEICHLPPGPGNGCTYTSNPPDSFEEYENHRPSGENAVNAFSVWPPTSSRGVPGFQPSASLPSIDKTIRDCCGDIGLP